MHRSSTHHRFVSPRRRGFSRGLALWLGLLGTALLPQAARADGCYSCGGAAATRARTTVATPATTPSEARKGCERKGLSRERHRGLPRCRRQDLSCPKSSRP